MRSESTQELRKLLDEYMRRIEERLQRIEMMLQAQFGPIKTEKDLDQVYEQVKDRLGMTTIKILRQQLGMSLDQFLARFRDYLMRNYELYPGGDEGIVLNGVVHGVVRKKPR